MRLIDGDELKSLYSKEENAIRNKLFSVIDRTPEVEEGKYKKLYEQMKAERDMYKEIASNSVSIDWARDWLNGYIAKYILHGEEECYIMVEKFVESAK